MNNDSSIDAFSKTIKMGLEPSFTLSFIMNTSSNPDIKLPQLIKLAQVNSLIRIIMMYIMAIYPTAFRPDSM